MHSLLHAIARRQQRMAYFVIWPLLFGLAIVLAEPAGWWAVIALWIVLASILEVIYRQMVIVVGRNRRTWWAKRRGDSLLATRASLFLAIAVIKLVYTYPFAGYVLLALMTMGLLCAAIIRWLALRDQA